MELSHVSPLESSSSVLPNQLVLEDFLVFEESLDGVLPLDELELPLPLRKPSIALPIILASTIALFPSHFKRFNGDLWSFFFLTVDLSVEFCADSDVELPAIESFGDSVNLSNVSFAKDTVDCAVDFILLVLFETGICRFVNQLAVVVATGVFFES